MALIAMAVHDTEENGRTELTRQCLDSLMSTISLVRHRLFIIDNGSCLETKKLLDRANQRIGVEVLTNSENTGTAAAINMAWMLRRPGENAVKMDNDVVFRRNAAEWIEQMDEAIARDTRIGIVGLKRKDCIETPWNENPFYRSELYLLPHQPGERWIVGEKVNHVMGTCQMYSSALLDKIGYLWQPRLYGFDDVIAAARCHAAGFINVFLPHIEIDHIDPGGTDYQKWKERHAGEDFVNALTIRDQIERGERSYYYNPFEV